MSVKRMSENKVNNLIETSKTREIKVKDSNPLFFHNDDDYEDQYDLREILSLKMFKVIQDLEKKLSKGRIKDKEVEKIRLDYLKTYINACNCYMSLSKNSNHFYNEETLRKFIDNDESIILELESDNE